MSRQRIALAGLLIGAFGLIVLTDALILGHHSVGYEDKMRIGFLLALGGGAAATLAVK